MTPRTPLPHQPEGIKFLMSTPKAILADEMGLGKTFQAIIAAIKTKVFPVLIICPAIVRNVWWHELLAANVPEQDILIVRRSTDLTRGTKTYNWIIISYELARSHLKKLGKPKMLIVDEAHKIKDINTPTNKAVSELAIHADYFWALTGTPCKNNYGEFYALVRLIVPMSVLAHMKLNSWNLFRDRFCEVITETIYVRGGQIRTITRIVGSKNPKQLGELIKPYMLRRRKVDVLKNLPQLWWQPLEVRLTKYIAVTQAQLDQAVDMAQHGTSFASHVDGEHIASLRAALALAKVAGTAEIIMDHLEESELPIVVFCCHLDAIHTLAETLRGKKRRVGVIVGATKDEQRAEIVRAFQDGELDVFIGQTRSAGIGITLTRASRSLHMDLDWSPAENWQARDRLHRIGQEHEVLSQYLVSDNPLDARVNTILAEKTAAIAQLEGHL